MVGDMGLDRIVVDASRGVMFLGYLDPLNFPAFNIIIS